MSNDEAFFFMSFPAVFYDDIYVKDSIKKRVQRFRVHYIYVFYIYISVMFFLKFLF